MIYDLLDTYKKSGEGERMAIDSYIPRPGLYIRLYTDGREADTLLINDDVLRSGELYNWFKMADYYSQLIEMNKPVDSKKQIHSNNIYSVYIKHDKLIENKKISSKFEENIERYYTVLENPEKDKKQESLFEHYYIPEINKETIHRNKGMILSLPNWLVDKVLSYDLKPNTYIKIFFDADIEEYKQESMRYLIPKIFNNNEYNIEADGTIYGLSNYNMGLNAKKPYLEHKTTNFRVPFRISISDALEIKNIFEWLENQSEEEKPVLSGYISINSEELFKISSTISKDINSHYVHLEKGIKTIVDDYDFLPGVTDKIEPFRLYNYLGLDDFNAETIKSRKILENMFDEWLYNSNLKKNYHVDKPKVRSGFSSRHVDLLNMSKYAMYNYFRKCDDSSIRSCIDKISLELIKESLLMCNYRLVEKSNIACAINLRLSLLKYFGIGGKENMGDIVVDLSRIVKDKVIDIKPEDEYKQCESDSEFYYTAGQLTRYLISCSQAAKVNYNLIDPILNAKDLNKIKSEIIKLITKYSYAINIRSYRINALISMVMGYEPKNPADVLHDIFLAGFASKNLVYFKEKEEEKNDNE